LVAVEPGPSAVVADPWACLALVRLAEQQQLLLLLQEAVRVMLMQQATAVTHSTNSSSSKILGQGASGSGREVDGGSRVMVAAASSCVCATIT
jgi:hypothetical protein